MKRTLIFAFTFATLLAFPEMPAQASVAVEACTLHPLNNEERAEESDVVFQGTVQTAECQCHQLASDEDMDGPQVECVDAITVNKKIKGNVDDHFLFHKMLTLDPNPNKQMWHLTCKIRVFLHNNNLIGKTSIYYMRYNAEGLLEPAPSFECR